MSKQPISLNDLIVTDTTEEQLLLDLGDLDSPTLTAITDMVDAETHDAIDQISKSVCTCKDLVTHCLSDCQSDTVDMSDIIDDLMMLNHVNTCISKVDIINP